MPRINTTPMVRIALWALRIYLLILLSLIGLKFASVFSHSSDKRKPDATASGAADQTPKAGNTP